MSVAKIVLHKRNLVYSLNLHQSSLIRFISSDSITTHQNSFTISYLINTCGLSPQKAVSASKKVHFESSTNPDSVLTLFRNNGFSDSHISRITAAHPRLLVSSVDKTLKPKFDFFNSKGLSRDDLVKVLPREGTVLIHSLEKKIIPSFDFLKSVVETDENVIAVLKRCLSILRYDLEKNLVPNVALLRTRGVPHSNIAKLLVSQPRVFLRNPCWFSEKVEEVERMKFDPSKYMFLKGIQSLDSMSRSSLEAKFDVYRSWGWSEDQVQSAFRTVPFCMMISVENIMSTMNCFVNKFGYDSSFIARHPSVLLYSCEKRIIPRCSVIQVLIKNGQLNNAPSLGTLLGMSEKKFLKYIRRFDKKVPDLPSAC